MVDPRHRISRKPDWKDSAWQSGLLHFLRKIKQKLSRMYPRSCSQGELECAIFLNTKVLDQFVVKMALANLDEFRHKSGLPTIRISILHRWLLVDG